LERKSDLVDVKEPKAFSGSRSLVEAAFRLPDDGELKSILNHEEYPCTVALRGG